MSARGEAHRVRVHLVVLQRAHAEDHVAIDLESDLVTTSSSGHSQDRVDAR